MAPAAVDDRGTHGPWDLEHALRRCDSCASVMTRRGLAASRGFSRADARPIVEAAGDRDEPLSVAGADSPAATGRAHRPAAGGVHQAIADHGVVVSARERAGGRSVVAKCARRAAGRGGTAVGRRRAAAATTDQGSRTSSSSTHTGHTAITRPRAFDTKVRYRSCCGSRSGRRQGCASTRGFVTDGPVARR